MTTDGARNGGGAVGGEVRIGGRLKLERQRRGLSLRALGEKTGFSASFLSQLELDQASPSLASLARLAQALGVGLGEILAEAAPTAAGPLVFRAADRGRLRSDWSRATMSSLLPAGADERLSVTLIDLEPGGRAGDPGAALHGREFALCVKGTVVLTMGTTCHRLGEGDSVFYEASARPQWATAGRARAQLLLASLR